MSWKVKFLGDVCEIINGSTPLRSNKDFWENGQFPWFTIDDIRQQGRIINHTKQKVTEKALSKLRILPKDSVLLCCTASVGEYAITNIEITTNQQFNGLVVKNKKELNPIYLMHYCSILKDKLLNLSGKTTIDFIAISKLKNLEIPLPPLSEQQAIVEKLDAAFALIDQAKANIEKNIQNAKELFQSKLNQIFSQKGEGWEERKLGEVVKFTNGRNQKGVIDANGKYPILGSAGNLMGYASQYLSEAESVIIGRKGNISKPLFINERFWNVDTAFALFPKENKLIPKLTYYMALNIDFESFNKGTTIPSLVKSDLVLIDISYPKSLQTQQEIVLQLDVLSEQTKQLETKYQTKLANLEELRKSILEKAFKGELVQMS